MSSLFSFIKFFKKRFEGFVTKKIYPPRNWCPSKRGSYSASGQSIRAYHFWHHNEMTLDSMCTELTLRKRQGGLKPATVM